MTLTIDYENQYTYVQIKQGGKSDAPKVTGSTKYLFRICNPTEGIRIGPSSGILLISKKISAGNYILEIEVFDSNTKEGAKTRHVVFVRDPNNKYPGDDDDITDISECSTCKPVKNKKITKPINHTLNKHKVCQVQNKKQQNNKLETIKENKTLNLKTLLRGPNIKVDNVKKNMLNKSTIDEKRKTYYITLIILGLIVTFFRTFI